jgi:uncharacterized membrane protein
MSALIARPLLRGRYGTFPLFEPSSSIWVNYISPIITLLCLLWPFDKEPKDFPQSTLSRTLFPMESPDTYSQVLRIIVHVADGIGVAILIAGLFFSAFLAIRTWSTTRDGSRAYMVLRRTLGGAILAGLEVLVAGDLIRTVAVDPTLDNVIILGIIVLIRTFLSFSLEIEIEGTLPWRRALTQTGASVIADAVRKSAPAPHKG